MSNVIIKTNNLLTSSLQGIYNFCRYIEPQGIICQGTAMMQNISEKLIEYKEYGFYILSGTRQEFYQRGFFKLSDSHLYILKADNTILHQFKLDHNLNFPIRLTHTYQCKNDTYSIHLDIVSKEEFHTYYTILGPNKNHTIETQFRRQNS